MCSAWVLPRVWYTNDFIERISLTWLRDQEHFCKWGRFLWTRARICSCPPSQVNTLAKSTLVQHLQHSQKRPGFWLWVNIDLDRDKGQICEVLTIFESNRGCAAGLQWASAQGQETPIHKMEYFPTSYGKSPWIFGRLPNLALSSIGVVKMQTACGLHPGVSSSSSRITRG
jgi:hypothetical protein